VTCGHYNSKIIESRRKEETNGFCVVRKRVCVACKERFSTRETIQYTSHQLKS